jgi:hypothetical protein
MVVSNPLMPTRTESRSTSARCSTSSGGTGSSQATTCWRCRRSTPGLVELANTGVHWLTGLPLVSAQILVVLLARSHLTKPA